MEVEKVLQQRAPGLRGCSVYSLRSHIFAGSAMDNYILGAFRGIPNGKGKRGAEMRRKGKRLPCLLPMGKRYLENRLQFIHVDDVARLIAYSCRRTDPETQRLTVLNVPAAVRRSQLARCLEIAHATAPCVYPGLPPSAWLCVWCGIWESPRLRPRPLHISSGNI